VWNNTKRVIQELGWGKKVPLFDSLTMPGNVPSDNVGMGFNLRWKGLLSTGNPQVIRWKLKRCLASPLTFDEQAPYID
jgi:hypothetical protein